MWVFTMQYYRANLRTDGKRSGVGRNFTWQDRMVGWGGWGEVRWGRGRYWKKPCSFTSMLIDGLDDIQSNVGNESAIQGDWQQIPEPRHRIRRWAHLEFSQVVFWCGKITHGSSIPGTEQGIWCQPQSLERGWAHCKYSSVSRSDKYWGWLDINLPCFCSFCIS